MDEQIRQRRIRAVRNATASTRIEFRDYIPDPQVSEWTEKWINQEITGEQLHSLVLEMCRKKADEANKSYIKEKEESQ